MPAEPRYTAQQVSDALLDTAGIKSAAARKLGCTHQTVDNYIARYPTVAAAYEQARASIVDKAESVLLQKLNRNEWDAAKFVLTTLGKDRGWGQTLDVRIQLEELARQIADETGQPFDAVLPVVTNLADERRKRRAA